MADVYIKQINSQSTAYKIKAAADYSGNILMDGQLKRNGTSSSWGNGRDHALTRIATYSGYSPILSCKTTDGSGELGPHSSNVLQLTYVPDSEYTSGANASTHIQYHFRPDASGSASVRSIYYGTTEPSGGNDGEVYIRYI